MKKYTINLSKLSLCSDPISDLYALFGFDATKKTTPKTLATNLINLSEDIYIELVQFGLVSDAMLDLINLFEDCQQESKYLHVSRSLG